MNRSTRQLTIHDRRRLALDSFCDERTIARWLAGLPVRESSALRLEAALKRLGINLTVRPRIAA